MINDGESYYNFNFGKKKEANWSLIWGKITNHTHNGIQLGSIRSKEAKVLSLLSSVTYIEY